MYSLQLEECIKYSLVFIKNLIIFPWFLSVIFYVLVKIQKKPSENHRKTRRIPSENLQNTIRKAIRKPSENLRKTSRKPSGKPSENHQKSIRKPAELRYNLSMYFYLCIPQVTSIQSDFGDFEKVGGVLPTLSNFPILRPKNVLIWKNGVKN